MAGAGRNRWGGDHRVSDHQARRGGHRRGGCPLVHRRGLEPGTTYTIKVQAKNVAGYGPTKSVTLKTKSAPPSAPRSLKVSSLTRTSGKVSWTAPAENGGAKITGYRIIKPGKDVTVKATARSYTVKKLKAGKAYTIKVQARNAKGYSKSAAIRFKTKAPAVKLKHYPNCAALRRCTRTGWGSRERQTTPVATR